MDRATDRGSISLGHRPVIIFNENHLLRLLRRYLAHCHGCRTHFSLEKDAPDPRPVETPDQGNVVEIPMKTPG